MRTAQQVIRTKNVIGTGYRLHHLAAVPEKLITYIRRLL